MHVENTRFSWWLTLHFTEMGWFFIPPVAIERLPQECKSLSHVMGCYVNNK